MPMEITPPNCAIQRVTRLFCSIVEIILNRTNRTHECPHAECARRCSGQMSHAISRTDYYPGAKQRREDCLPPVRLSQLAALPRCTGAMIQERESGSYR